MPSDADRSECFAASGSACCGEAPQEALGRRETLGSGSGQGASSDLRTRRSSLPVSLWGNSARNSMRSGTRVERSRSLTHARSSSASGGLAGSGRATTTAAICSPHSRDGIPIDGDVVDVRVGAQHLLDLAGGDVLAAADDDVVEPSLDVQVPGGVERAAVVGREPAVIAQPCRARRTPRTPGRRGPRSHRTRRAAPAHRAGRGTDTSISPCGRPTDPRRRRTAGSSEAIASRWSSGPSTEIVELVSVSP